MKSIHWLVPYQINHNQDISNKNVASIRLRAGLFNLPCFNDFTVSFNENIYDIDEIDYLFVGKFAGNREDLVNTWVEIINLHRGNGKKIFFDYTDHHLDKDTLAGQFYRASLNSNDQIITSSEKLKNHLSPNFKNITIIEDPIEIQIEKVKKSKESSFLFFGHHTNLKYLFNLINNWNSKIQSNLIIQTSEEGMDEIRNQSQHISKPSNLNIQFQLWSIENMLKASTNVSGIIIPGDISDDRKNGVSHNRLITAFALGLPVAATRYQSYLEFDHQFVDIDNQTEFENFLQNPSLYSSRVEMAQKKVKNYTQENIAKKWFNLIK
ncbi:MAG: hypothetical protein O3C61_07575 [Proteobacteria bacterium]|nr:hypothetical protein [Pseudomonadota bacterium]